MLSVLKRAPAAMRPLLVRQSHIGEFGAPAPRPALPADDPVMRWGRWGLLPVSSVMRVQTDDRVVGLTYDDGPEPAETAELLDVLRDRHVSATFFVLSERVQAHAELVERMLREGHEVELHGIDHTRLTELRVWDAVRRLRTGRRHIEAVTGRPVRFYRPTYGAVNLSALLSARLQGMDVVIWSAWAEDWYDAPAEEVAARAIGALHPGAILLLHDTTDKAWSTDLRPAPSFSRADLARRILDAAEGDGYQVLPVGELLRRYPAVRAVTVQRPRLRLR